MSKFDRHKQKKSGAYIYPHKHCQKCGEMIDEKYSYCKDCYKLIKEKKEKKRFRRKSSSASNSNSEEKKD